MKHYRFIFLFMIVAFTVTSCGLDNYDAPQSRLQGKITYNGEELGLRGTGEAVQLQLYQDGYQLRDYIRVYVGQDGSFEALLFDGVYKLVTRDKNGPWVNNRDTIVVNLKGSADVEVPVTPYFTISNELISLSGNVLNATFNVNKIVSTANIDYVTLLVSKTSFVDDVTYIARKDFRNQLPGSLNLSMDLSDNTSVAAAKALFARVGVRAVGADQAIYSDIVRLK
jgi:hypothetical protein